MSLRQDRLADEIRDIVATTLNGFHDDNLLQVAITHVRLTPDLQLASIYFRVFNQDLVKQTQDSLELVRAALRRKLASELRLRRVPALRFFYDESVEKGSRIEKILYDLRA